MKRIITISVITSSLLFAEENYLLEKSVVSAQGESDDIIYQLEDYQSELPTRSVSVITTQEILNNGSAGGVHGLLESVPGIMYARSGANSGQISVRGMNSNNSRSIIAIDGVRVVGRSTLELNMIDPNSLEGIEVIRGAASSLYGSNAINGVINFKTRRYRGDINAPFRMDAKVRAVEYNSVNNGFGSRVELLGGGDGWDILIGAHGKKAGSYRTPEGVAHRSNYETWGTDFNISYTKNDVRYYTQGKFQRAFAYSASGDLITPGSSYGGIFGTLPLSEYYLRAGAEAWDLGFADKMDAYVYWRHYDTDLIIDKGAFAISPSRIYRQVYNTNQVGGNVSFTKAFTNHTLDYGIQVLSQISPDPVKNTNLNTGVTATGTRPTTTTELAAFLKDDWRVTDKLTLSGSLRYDYMLMQIGSEKFTGETAEMSAFLDNNKSKTTGALTGSIGALYALNDKFSLVTNVSQNFKSPGTSGLFPSVSTEANHDLKSEYAQTYEVGMRYHDRNHYASLVAFRTDYTDMIQNVMIRSGITQSQNVGKAYIQGVEFESHHKFDKWFLDLVAAYTYGQDKSADKPLAYIAPLYGNISFGYNFDWGYAKWTQKAYLGKTRIDPTQERESDSYTMSDVNVSLDLGYFQKNWKDMWLTLGVENLFNQKGRNPVTQEDINYPVALTNPLLEPGTNVFLKFAYQY